MGSLSAVKAWPLIDEARKSWSHIGDLGEIFK